VGVHALPETLAHAGENRLAKRAHSPFARRKNKKFSVVSPAPAGVMACGAWGIVTNGHVASDV
jgi:hypothetical protein